MVMVFNTNNISAILWRSVLLVEETRSPGENHKPAVNHWQNLSHNVVSSTPRHERIRTRNLSGDRHWSHRWWYWKLDFYSKIYFIYILPDSFRQYALKQKDSITDVKRNALLKNLSSFRDKQYQIQSNF